MQDMRGHGMTIDPKPYFDAWQAAEKDAAELAAALSALLHIAVNNAWRYGPSEEQQRSVRIRAAGALDAHAERLEAPMDFGQQVVLGGDR